MATSISNPAQISLPDAIQRELIRLHILPSMLGHHYLAYVIERAATDPLRIRGITKDLYLEMSQVYRTNWKAIDHAIRTARDACWDRGGRGTLDKMARCHLAQRPCATEFISIVAAYIGRVYCR